MSKILAMSTVISGVVEDIEVSNIRTIDYLIRSNLQDVRIECLVDSIKQHGLPYAMTKMLAHHEHVSLDGFHLV